MADARLPLALFDLDDTLCDYSGARAIRLRIAFSRAGGIDEETIERMADESIRLQQHGTGHFHDLFASYGVTDPAHADAAADWYRTNRFHGLGLYPDTVRVLGDLRDRGHTIGIITNGPAEIQRAKIELLGVDRLADFVLISGEFGAAKPDPAIFHAALDLGNRPPEKAIHVGDLLEFDIAGANNTGIRSVWMNRHGALRNPSDPEPVHEVGDLDAVAGILRNWRGT